MGRRNSKVKYKQIPPSYSARRESDSFQPKSATKSNMAIDDTVVIGLILVIVVLLFGASRIPSLARSLGQARREYEKGAKGETSAESVQSSSTTNADDPLFVAAQKEGIDTQGKTREQIASELSWKLSKK